MGGAPVVLVLVGLVFPIVLLLVAIAFDVAFATWLAYRWWRRIHPRRQPVPLPVGVPHA